MCEEYPGEIDFASSCQELTVYREYLSLSWNRAEKKAKVLKKVYARGKIIKQSFENVRMYEELAGGFYPTWPKDNSILYLYNSSHHGHDQPHTKIDDYQLG